jgi:hypothetical protein
MKRKGREESFGSVRVMWRRLAGVEFASVGCEGGTKRPASRKDLMLDIRRREDAEGERRMIGSARLEFETAGREVSAAEGWARGFGTGALRCLFLPKKVSAALRT